MTNTPTNHALLTVFMLAGLGHPMSAQDETIPPVEATEIVEVAVSGMT